MVGADAHGWHLAVSPSRVSRWCQLPKDDRREREKRRGTRRFGRSDQEPVRNVWDEQWKLLALEQEMNRYLTSLDLWRRPLAQV